MLLLKTSKLNNSSRTNIKLVFRKMKEALIGVEKRKITDAPSFGQRLLKKELL